MLVSWTGKAPASEMHDAAAGETGLTGNVCIGADDATLHKKQLVHTSKAVRFLLQERWNMA